MLAAAIAIVATAAVASAAPDSKKGNGPKLKRDDLAHPLGEKQKLLREKAIAAKLAGKVPATAKVVKVGEGAKGAVRRGRP